MTTPAQASLSGRQFPVPSWARSSDPALAPERQKRVARDQLAASRSARLQGDPGAASHALQRAGTARATAQTQLGIPSGSPMGRTNTNWSHRDVKATRRLP